MRRPTVDVRVASGNYWGNDGFGFFFQRNWSVRHLKRAHGPGWLVAGLRSVAGRW
jgi:hypothetical protein